MANDFRCDECGHFVSYDDLDKGRATNDLVTPDSDYTYETFETLCAKHASPLAGAARTQEDRDA